MSDDHPPQFDPEELDPDEAGSRNLTRRGLLAAAGVGGLSAAFGLSPAQARGALPESWLSQAAGTVTLGSYEENAGIPALLADTKLFTKKFGIEVKTNTYAHGPFQEHINNYLQGRPQDVFTWFAGFRMQFFAAKGLATPIDDVWAKLLTAQMPPAFKAASTGADGHQYFVPNKNYPWAVYFRKSLWKEKGYTAPKTWAQFIALAKKMDKDGLTPIAFTDKDGWPPMGTFDIINMRINGYKFHVDLMAGKQAWDGPQVKAVFKKWTELFPYYSEGALGLSWQDGAAALENKQAGMFLLGGFLTGAMKPAERKGHRLLPVPDDQPEVGPGLDRCSDRRLHDLEEAEEPGRCEEAGRVPRHCTGDRRLPQDQLGQPRFQQAHEHGGVLAAAEEGSEADRGHQEHRAVHGPRHAARLRLDGDDPVAATVHQQSRRHQQDRREHPEAEEGDLRALSSSVSAQWRPTSQRA